MKNRLSEDLNCSPKVRHKTFGVQFNYEAFIKREITNYSAFDRWRVNQTCSKGM